MCRRDRRGARHGIIHRDIKPSNLLFSRVARCSCRSWPTSDGPRLGAGCRRESRGPPARERDAPPESLATVPLFSPRWAAPSSSRARRGPGHRRLRARPRDGVHARRSGRSFAVPKIDTTYPERISATRSCAAARLTTSRPRSPRPHGGPATRIPGVRRSPPSSCYEGPSHAFGTPRASLPAAVSHSGGVPTLPPPRKSQGSISVEVAFKAARPAVDRSRPSSGPRSEAARCAPRRDPREARPDVHPGIARSTRGRALRRRRAAARQGSQFSVNLKGLSCFIGKPGRRSSEPSHGGRRRRLRGPRLTARSGSVAPLLVLRRARGTPGATSGQARVFPIAAQSSWYPSLTGSFAPSWWISLRRGRSS